MVEIQNLRDGKVELHDGSSFKNPGAEPQVMPFDSSSESDFESDGDDVPDQLDSLQAAGLSQSPATVAPAPPSAPAPLLPPPPPPQSRPTPMPDRGLRAARPPSRRRTVEEPISGFDDHPRPVHTAAEKAAVQAIRDNPVHTNNYSAITLHLNELYTAERQMRQRPQGDYQYWPKTEMHIRNYIHALQHEQTRDQLAAGIRLQAPMRYLFEVPAPLPLGHAAQSTFPAFVPSFADKAPAPMMFGAPTAQMAHASLQTTAAPSAQMAHASLQSTSASPQQHQPYRDPVQTASRRRSGPNICRACGHARKGHIKHLDRPGVGTKQDWCDNVQDWVIDYVTRSQK